MIDLWLVVGALISILLASCLSGIIWLAMGKEGRQ